MAIEFRRERFDASALAPDGSQRWTRTLEVRFDPLLGTTSRIAEGVRLDTSVADALAQLRAPDDGCPFCRERLERDTPRIDPGLSDEPRITVGETVLFPNLVPYSRYAAVALFTREHWLDLQGFTPKRIADSLSASLRYMRAVHDADAAAAYAAWNVNYLYPSGGSLPHPHAQVFLDPLPTTRMRLEQEADERFLREQGVCFWEELVDAERERGERFLWEAGSTAWMTAFAPLGFNEVRAVVRGRESLLELTDGDVEALAWGMARVLSRYAKMGYDSFNASLTCGPLGGGAGHRVRLTMVTRSALVPFYRSDAMYLERLHWEAAVDRLPEELAADLRVRVADGFSSSRG